MSDAWGDVSDGPDEVRIVSLPEFAGIEEAGIEALLGTIEQNLLPVGGDAMLYGDGGAGKTTLAIDLAFHLASGLDWLGIAVEAPRSILLVENEGPRPLFRRKLRKRLAAWDGPPIGERLHVWEHPWAGFSFTEADMRAQLAQTIFEREVDLVIAGPVTQLGMEDAGTIREVRSFAAQVALVRERSLRPVASLLVHHEAKSGRVSGAWEGVGDTLLHVSGSGHGRTRVTIQKARWGSAYHATTLHLRWVEGESFSTEGEDTNRPERVWQAILDFVGTHPGTGWTPAQQAVGGEKKYAQRRRDQMLADGTLVDLGRGAPGPGHRFELWLPDVAPEPLPIDDPESSREGSGDSGYLPTPGRSGASTGESPVPLYVSRGDSSGDLLPPGDEVAAQSPDTDPDIDW